MVKIAKGEVAEKYLVVRITMNGPNMVAGNQDLSMFGVMKRSPGQDELHDQLRKQVLEKGQELPVRPGRTGHRFKAYFYGMYKGRTGGNDGHIIKINPEHVLPMEEW